MTLVYGFSAEMELMVEGVADNTPPHNWGAEMNYTPREPAPERVAATVENKATMRIAGARDPVSQK